MIIKIKDSLGYVPEIRQLTDCQLLSSGVTIDIRGLKGYNDLSKLT
jgi:hypothetical protein